jgi:hypothetical protein
MATTRVFQAMIDTVLDDLAVRFPLRCSTFRTVVDSDVAFIVRPPFRSQPDDSGISFGPACHAVVSAGSEVSMESIASLMERCRTAAVATVAAEQSSTTTTTTSSSDDDWISSLRCFVAVVDVGGGVLHVQLLSLESALVVAADASPLPSDEGSAPVA